jgi:LPXTG-motif cell wall-anchored protein
VKKSLLVFVGACVMLASAAIASAQAAYTVVTVLPDGTVVLRGPSGVRSYQVPAGTTFNADGKAGTAIADLKPGMKLTGTESGIASWKATDVMVHEELNAEVVAKAGNSMMIRGAKGVEKYEWKEASDITIVKDGKVVDASAINVGDRITGMVVQKSVAGRAAMAAAPAAVQDTSAADAAAARKAAADKAAADAAAAKKAAADKAAADAAARKAAAADKAAADAAAAKQAAADKAAADAAAKAAAGKKLPKTATELPLMGFAGLLALGAGAGLTAIRKSRSAK